MSLAQLLVQSLVDALRKAGVNADVQPLGDKVTITIPASEIQKQMLSQIPPQYQSIINVRSGDVIIEVKLT